MPVSNRDELYASLSNGRSGFDAIRRTQESDWIDFKQSHYRLSDNKQKLELAKDVSGFANAGGGVICVGIKTERLSDRSLEVASKLTPVKAELLNLGQIRDILRRYVYPLIVDLECRVWEMEDDTAVLTIGIPKQDSEDRPFVVTEGISDDGEHYGNMFGCFVREADTTQPTSPYSIHHLLRDGERLRRILADPNSMPATRAREASVPDERGEEQRRARAEEDAEDLRVSDQPYLVVQAWKAPGFRVPDIQGEFKNRFLSPPQIRGSTGFNVGFAKRLEVLQGGGLRKTRRERISLSVLPDGLSTLIVGSFVLGWGMESRSSGRELINPIPLVELVYEFCRFVATYVRGTSNESGFSVQARLRHLDVEGARRLAGGPRGDEYGLEGPDLPAGGASEVATETVVGTNPEEAAFELLAGIYLQYGLGESAVPFADTASHSISKDKFLQYLSS